MPNSLKHGAWLIPLGIGGIFTGGILALLGLLWSRWLRPFNRITLIGYSLCWLSITLAPVALFKLRGYRQPEDLWFLGIYVLSACACACACAWLTLRHFFVLIPSRSIGRAVLIASIGSLFLAPAVTSGGQVLVFLPLNACIAWNVIGWAKGGAVPPPLIALVGMLPAIPVFAAQLIIYWPFRNRPLEASNNPITESPDNRVEQG